MICRRRSPREKQGEDRAARERGLTVEQSPAGPQAPPPVFRAPALRGVPGSGDRRRPDGGSLAVLGRPATAGAGSEGRSHRPAAQDKRQTLHLVSGRGSGSGRELRPGPAHTWLGALGPAAGERRRCADFGTGSGDSTCAPGMELFTWLCAALGAPPSAPS